MWWWKKPKVTAKTGWKKLEQKKSCFNIEGRADFPKLKKKLQLLNSWILNKINLSYGKKAKMTMITMLLGKETWEFEKKWKQKNIPKSFERKSWSETKTN